MKLPENKLDSLEIVNPNAGEKRNVLIESIITESISTNAGEQRYIPLDIVPTRETLFEFFENTVDRYPDFDALISEDRTLSYMQLDEYANQLANLIHQRGIGPGDFVGIYLDRSIKPIISILAVLKSGAAYIPLDSAYPEDRIKYILDETSMSLMISEKELVDDKDGITCPIILLDELDILNQYSKERLPRSKTSVTENDLSYILFTSGTTGRPKGIMTEHRNVVGFASSFNKIIQLTPEDRIYQGFSIGFDGSVEEIWMAFSNGASLIVGNPVAAKLPDEAARIMNELKVTVFSSVPTFLGLIKVDIPSLRLAILSGERCPEDLVNIWSTETRRVLNVYGPTETTVNTTAKECFPRQEITIGNPLDGYDIYILDELLNQVEQGQHGELYVGGIGVARGYHKRDDLTSKTFIENPFYYSEIGGSRKIYKTGDKVCLLDNGELQFFGRLDTQVKIRGFRVELSEIELILNEAPHIKNVLVHAVKRPDGHLELAAYVIPECDKEDFDYDGILTLLNSRLPHYMVPNFLDLLEEFPMLASGKANRRALPAPERALVLVNQNIKLPQNKIEKKMVSAWKQIFSLDEVSVDADFFMDLAGYSLLAVEAVSLLRSDYDIYISVRELYKYKTIEKIAKQIEEMEASKNIINKTSKKPRKNAREVFESVPVWERYLCYLFQASFIFSFIAINMIHVGIFAWMGIEVFHGNMSPYILIGFSAFFIIFGYPLHVLTNVALKWIIIGEYKKGEYPLWSLYYCRWWIASRIQAMTLVGSLTGTPLMNIYLRLMGAKVGRNTLINTTSVGSYDLISIGSNTSIGDDAKITGSKVENGMLIIGGVEVGDGCFVGDSCVLSINSKMNNNSNLEDMSLLLEGQITIEGMSYLGSPAELGNVPLPNVNNIENSERPILFSVLHMLAIQGIELFFLCLALPVIALMIAGFYYGGIYGLLGATLFNSFFGVVLTCFGVALARFIIMPQTPTGIFKVNSFFYIRKWTMDKIFLTASQILLPLFTTIYLPSWLRLMGAKIGKFAEISTVGKMTPDLTVIGDGSFFADGAMIGGLRLYRGHIELRKNKIGKKSFVGNNAHLSSGKSLGDNCLLGVLSTAPIEYDETPENSEWLGIPSFALPHREKITSFDLVETFNPTLSLYIQRCIIDGIRILLPNFLMLASAAYLVMFIYYVHTIFNFVEMFLLVAGVEISLMFVVATFMVVLKTVLMGTYKPVIKPLWCKYVWFNELVNGVYEALIAPILTPFLGTPFINWYFRMLGCKIGKHTYIDTTLFSEWDLVRVGDYASLSTDVIIQNHLFEDRVMKSSYVDIGDECSVGSMSIVLYDSEIKNRTTIGPLSLVMKGDSLPGNSNWIGVPISES